MSPFWIVVLAFVVLPIPLGVLWVWIYRIRRSLGFPDWLGGILARGIKAGHYIGTGIGTDEDYWFIIAATVVLISVSVSIFLCLWGMSL